MSGNKVDSLLTDQIEVSRIAYVGSSRYSARSIKGIVVKTQPVLCYHDGFRVDIYPDSVAAKQFALYKRSPAPAHLVENKLSWFGIFRDQVPWYVGTPISTIIPRMGRPVTPTREAPHSEL